MVSGLPDLGQATRIAECARYQRIQAYLTGIAVDLDAQTEGVEKGAALRCAGSASATPCRGQEGSDDRGGVLWVDGCAVPARAYELERAVSAFSPLPLRVRRRDWKGWLAPAGPFGIWQLPPFYGGPGGRDSQARRTGYLEIF